MKWLLICLSFSISFKANSQDLQSKNGTTTITIVTPDTIWMAADSKKVTKQKDKIIPDGFHNKIRTVRNFYYTIAGYYRIFDNLDKTILNFDSLMLKCIEGNSNLDTVIAHFKKESVKELFRLARENFSFFVEMRKANPIIISVAICSNYNNTLNIKFLDIAFVGTGDTLGFEPINYDAIRTSYIQPIGAREEIYKILHFPGFSWDLTLIKEAIIYLIELESKAHRDIVGGTIDVIKIFKGGSQWLTNNHY